MSFLPIAFLPETYKPVILRRKAQKLRRQDPHWQIYAPIELRKQTSREMITITLTRPIRMFFGETIVFFSSVYLAFISAVYCELRPQNLTLSY